MMAAFWGGFFGTFVSLVAIFVLSSFANNKNNGGDE